MTINKLFIYLRTNMKKQLSRPISLLYVVFFCFIGCANSAATYMTTKRFDPILLDEVVVFLSETDLPKEYEKVALIETSYISDGEQHMWKSVTKKAASLGANGVYMLSKKETSKGVQLAAAVLMGVPTNDKAQFVAIRFKKQE